MSKEPAPTLRRGWTTGACAAAATKAAATALATGRFPDTVDITLPKGERPRFALAESRLDGETATVGIVKDAGDDPDVTHGALIRVALRRGLAGSGLIFKAGPGVGMVTRPGLPVAVGEPAINPGPRAMIAQALGEVAAGQDWVVEIAVPGGEVLARRTWNPRLGIVGGLSILGTTGVVVPYSCSAWISAITSGVDVARAAGLDHIAAATGAKSEALARQLCRLDDPALIDMGDFVGGLLKYLRRHPVARLTLAGGFAKMVKLGQGALDLHSGRARVDFDRLARMLADLGAGRALVAEAQAANTAMAVLEMAGAAGLEIGALVAEAARATVLEVLDGAPIAVEVLVCDRAGQLVGRA